MPLTTNETRCIQANIAAMQHWSGGGTNQAEGLAWGWRVLSPTAPFTEGVAFNGARDNVRKVIVLMSDGENTNVGNDAVMESDFSAYNYLGFWTTTRAAMSLTQLLFGVLHGILPSQFQPRHQLANEFVAIRERPPGGALHQHQERRHRDLRGLFREDDEDDR